MSEQYKKEQDKRNILKIRELSSTLPSFMRDYFTYLTESRHLSSRTVLGYAQDLETFCFFLQMNNPLIGEYKDITTDILGNLKPQDINEYMAFLTVYEKDGTMYENAASGKARKLSSLKSFWKWMIGFTLLDKNPTLLITPPKQTKKEIVKLEKSEIQEVLEGIKDGEGLIGEHAQKYSKNICLRDMALISLLLGTGMRISECVGLDMKDLSFRDNSVKIIRKGGNESRLYFNDDVKAKLENYVNNERKTPTDGSDALFLSTRGSRMSVRSAERRVKAYTEKIEDKKITPHKCRSTYATQLYRASHDIYLTADALGHASVQTTSRYADIGDTRRKEAAEYDVM